MNLSPDPDPKRSRNSNPSSCPNPQAARATIVALPGSKYVRWSQRTFYELQQEEDGQFAAAVQLMIARTLSRKLGEARQQTGRVMSRRATPASTPYRP